MRAPPDSRFWSPSPKRAIDNPLASMTEIDTPTTTPVSPRPRSLRPPPPPAADRRRTIISGLCIGAFLLIAGWLIMRFVVGWHSSKSGSAALPVVAVEKVGREDLIQTLTLSAEFRPY